MRCHYIPELTVERSTASCARAGYNASSAASTEAVSGKASASFVYDHFPYGADSYFEASGAAAAITYAADYLTPGGKIVFIGMTQGPVPIDLVAAQTKEIVMYTIFRYANDYQRAINFIASGQIDVKPLISKHYKFEESVEAFRFAASAPPDVIKTIIHLM